MRVIWFMLISCSFTLVGTKLNFAIFVIIVLAQTSLFCDVGKLLWWWSEVYRSGEWYHDVWQESASVWPTGAGTLAEDRWWTQQRFICWNTCWRGRPVRCQTLQTSACRCSVGSLWCSGSSSQGNMLKLVLPNITTYFAFDPWHPKLFFSVLQHLRSTLHLCLGLSFIHVMFLRFNLAWIR